MRLHNRRPGQRGNAMIEFALCVVVLLPLYIWTIVFGMDLKRMMQTGQVSRDAGHMYARGVDFSMVGNQDIIVRLASGLNMTRTGGSGVVILSRVMKVGPQQCADGGLTLSQCTNLNQHVFTQRIVIGNKALKPSRFGTPADTIVNSDGNINAVDYLKDASAVATNFSATLALNDGELAYVSEAWFDSPVKDFPTLNNRGPVYARTIF